MVIKPNLSFKVEPANSTMLSGQCREVPLRPSLPRDSGPRGPQGSAFITMKREGFYRKAKFLQKAVRLPLSPGKAQLSSGQVDVAKTLSRTSEPQAPCPGLTGSRRGVAYTRRSWVWVPAGSGPQPSLRVGPRGFAF